MPSKTLTIKRAIDAPAEEIYRAFTNSQALREWFCDIAFVQPREGGRLLCAWNTGDGPGARREHRQSLHGRQP
jgi:uncharacterized protein YndB with AHSA1/START domain